MRYALFLLLFISTRTLAAEPGEWTELLKPGDTTVWKAVDKNWIVTNDVGLAPDKANRLAAKPVEGGTIWVNGVTGRVGNLYTKQAYGDCEVHLEFMLAKGSNSGLKFHGTYEIQLLDSFGSTKLSGNSNGGIYPRAKLPPENGYLDNGVPPKVNASKKPGEWQTLDVIWNSPRLNDQGEKVKNAKVVKAILNGEVIHENQEVKNATGGNWNKPEVANGPFMLQCDHGPTAFRNVKIRALK